MIGIIRNTTSQIGDKIEVKREIDTLLAAKKYEFQIMSMVPYGIIAYMSLSFSDFMEELYGNVTGIGGDDAMSRNLRGRLLSWSKAPENRRIVKAAGLIIALGILVTGADMACSRIQMTPSIERNDYGKGKKVEELDVEIGNKKKKVRTSVEVSERQYSAKEVQELFSRIIRKMDRLILAGNETLDRVDEDLDLVTDIPGEPVKVSWELDRYDVMDIQGKLKEQNISEKGVLVKLNAVLTYTANEKEQASYQCVACVYPKN